jgi:hypothetical protein
MTIMELGALGEFVGAIAVVLTLVYLAVQVRQNTAGLRAAAYQSWLTGKNSHQVVAAQPHMSAIIDAGIADSRNLDVDSWGAFVAFYRTGMQLAQASHLLHERGFLERELMEIEMKTAAGLLTFPGIRQWWDAGGKVHVTREFAKQVESTEPGAVYRWTKEAGFVAAASVEGVPGS